jgi:outer membrane protein
MSGYLGKTQLSFQPFLVFGLLLCCSIAAAADDLPVLTLDQAIQIAITNNRSLKVASLEIDKSKWELASTKTRRLPSFNTAMFASGNLTSPSFTFKRGIFGSSGGGLIPSVDTKVQLSNGVTGYALAQVAQPLSQLWKIHLGVQESRLGVDYSSEQYRGKRQSVVSDVKQAYYAVLQTESSLDSANTQVKQYEETDRISLQYVAQEVVLKSESLEVKAKLAQSKYQVIVLQNDLQTQKEHLNDLLARDLETDFRTEQVPPISLAETDLKMAQQKALTQRPEIREAAINVQKADYDRKIAKAAYIPDVSAAFHYFTPINTEILPQNIASVGLDLTWEPFEWGRRKDEVNEKGAILDQTQLQLKQAQSQVVLDVNKNFRKLTQSRAGLEVAEAARDAANQKLKEVRDKFSQQAVLLRDVLQQQSAVASADHDYEEALLSFWSAKADFEKAMGEE